MAERFAQPPSGMTREAFVARFGSVYEHSAWIAESVWDQGLTEESDAIDKLAAAMAEVLDLADTDRQLALIRAHPDLAGRAAIAGELTEASSAEQAGAGLDRCTPEEYQQFQQLNDAYKEKFGFPFILAVKGRTRQQILAAFQERVTNTREQEFATALEQIHRIALMRLKDL